MVKSLTPATVSDANGRPGPSHDSWNMLHREGKFSFHSGRGTLPKRIILKTKNPPKSTEPKLLPVLCAAKHRL